MRHVVSIQGYGIRSKNNVHLAGINSHTLCGLMALTRVIEGETFPVVGDTTRPVNCQACHKAIEMLVRRRLRDVSTEQLEHILEEIT